MVIDAPRVLENPHHTVQYDKIIHFSDIHIRTGDPERARYKEYSIVFQHLIQSLRAHSDLSKAVFLITGDLFHHKGKIEPAGIKLANQLFTNLLDIAPVLVICGNHDYRQDDPEIPDMIETLLELYHTRLSNKKYPLYYLNKTGHYTLNNLGFALVDIRDTLKSYNTFGRNESLEPFPKRDVLRPTPTDHHIALFHGSVAPREVYERFKNFNGYPLEWFSEYDYVLLGDIHKQQVHHTGDCKWGYPGSLIQQDFGERIIEHGYLEWDLTTKKTHFHPVYNPFGFCTLKKQLDTWYVHSHKKDWFELSTIVTDPMFPKNPIIRIANTEEVDCTEILEKYQIKPTKIQRWAIEAEKQLTLNPDEADQDHQQPTSLEELNTPAKWIDYLKQVAQIDYTQYIMSPELLKLPADYKFLKKYQERNEKIQKHIDEYNMHRIDTIEKANRVELMNMSWNYLMCYGENNFFDFMKIQDEIALLNGKNAMGKSSFLDILCIALYGEPTRMRRLVTGKKYTDKIIHDRRPASKHVPSVTLLLKNREDVYEIHRSFGTQVGKDKNEKDHLIKQKDVAISLVDLENNKKTIICEGNTMVERWIDTHIGTMESVLMSTMICQTDLNNFFHMKQDDQKAILDTALRLENVALYGKVIKESLLAHHDLQTQLKSTMDTITTMVKQPTSEENIETLQQTYQQAKDYVEKYTQLKEQWLIKICTKQWKNTPVPEDIEDIYREAKDQMDYAYNPTRFEELSTRLETSIRLEEKIRVIKEQLETYQTTSIYKDSEKHLDKWLKKKTKFMKMKPICDVSEEWIRTTKEKYQQWKASSSTAASHPTDSTSASAADAPPLTPSTPCPPTLKDVSHTFNEEEYIQIKATYDELKEREQIKPTHTVNYADWSAKNKEFLTWKNDQKIQKKLKLVQDKLYKLVTRQTELDQYEKDLVNVEKDLIFYQDLTFNPECHSCKTNPFNVKKQDLETSRSDLVSYCKNMKTYISKLTEDKPIKQLEKQKETCEQQINLYEKYLMEKDFYESVHQQWTAYNEWAAEYEPALCRMSAAADTKAHHDWHQYHIALANYTYQQEAKKWAEVLSEMTHHETQFALYQEWLNEQTILEEKILQFQKSLEKQKIQKEWDSHVATFETVKTDLGEWKKLVSIKENFEKYESEYAIHKLREIEPILAEHTQTLETAYQSYINVKQVQEQHEGYKLKMQEYERQLSQLEERYQSIKELDTHFIGDKTSTDGYKEWIYKNKVIPLLNNEMNVFLGLFEEFRFKMLYDKKQFIYMIEDRGNEPTLDKASGYQNFIISLAFRLSLTRIGAIGQQLKHLFIDEGFTACDASNIEKVPVLLKSILEYGHYHSIVLMSHMDSVRECTNRMIHIERHDPFSYIRYGDSYPTLVSSLKMKKTK